jgi:spermidine dehydrogenase
VTDANDDRALGAKRPITRRDFLNGVSIAGGAVVTGAALMTDDVDPAAAAATAPYPPALTGMRGSTDAARAAGHAVRDGTRGSGQTAVATGERYDLIVVGGGISGLSAAWFFRRRAGPAARILILENHDDFGGHARRNEFSVGRRRLIGYGGSQSIETPTPYSHEARGLMSALGVDPPVLAAQANDGGLYRGLGLRRGVFFDRETFGADRLVVGVPAAGATPEAWAAFLAPAPLSALAKADVGRLETADTDYMPALTPAEKKDRLSRISYRDFLVDVAKADRAVVPYYQSRTHGLYGVGIDAVPALDCWALGYPGFRGLRLAPGADGRLSRTAAGWAAGGARDYEFHYPDGNASIARLLVRALIPDAVPGASAEDVVVARIDYGRLDHATNPTRLRLDSTVVRAGNLGASGAPTGVEVRYARRGRTEIVHGAACVLACWNGVIPYLCPDLPEAQKQALKYGSKVPLVYTSVAIRDWSAFVKLGVRQIASPGGFHSVIELDRPVSLGGYRRPGSPHEPIVLHLVRTPCRPGEDARTQQRLGRSELLSMPFATFEHHVRDQLGRILGGAGFDPARDIAAITVNRWPHGYAYEYNPLWDPDWPPGQEPCVLGRRRFGRIAIANSDAGAYAYADAAIDQAYRAVTELALL